MTSPGTIAAISSAVAPAARMIVRVSGAEAHHIGAILCPQLPGAGEARETRLTFASLTTPAWVYRFAAPKSYTGEDLVEFHIPGNPVLARLLLDALIAAGARHAEPGEFTARAYFSGRLDLDEAEGVAAIVGAHSEQELRAARQLLAGELSRRLQPPMELLAQTLALVEAGIDFTDEDISFIAADDIVRRVAQIDGMLGGLVDSSSRFEPLTHEPTFVLVGRPNAGKSTLLNALAGHARAIVSPIAGTTRDALSAEVALRRGIVRVIDVAGIDGNDAPIEPFSPTRVQSDASATSTAPGRVASHESDIAHQMTARALRAVQSADHVVLVIDVTDNRAPLALDRGPDLVVHSKHDLAPDATARRAISAVTGEGVEALRDALDAIAFGAPAASTLALNARHLHAIADARAALSRANELAAAGKGAEIIAMELREALDALGAVRGQMTPDDVLGRIFAAFCIGK